MNGLDVGDFGGTYNSRDIKIALSRTGRADADGFIGKF